jgi:hypothetical protein
LRNIYRSWGVPQWALDLFKKMAEAPLKVVYGRDKQFKFKIKLSTPQTATGKPDTCLGNTLLNMHATIHVMEYGYQYEDFGFVAKLKHHNTAWRNHFGTFLKGAWILDCNRVYRWCPLLGGVMKLLKSFTPVKSLEVGLKQNLSSVGPVSTPLYRTLIERFAPSNYTKPITDYKIFATSTPDIPAAYWRTFINYRYGEGVYEAVVSLEAKLKTVSLGDYLYDPLWERLALVDYGDGVEDSVKDISFISFL